MAFLVSARTVYRDCLIELQQSDQGWRVLKVAHCLGEAESFFPPWSIIATVWLRRKIAD